MDFNKNPFSLYDFLGYFVPGAIFIYGLVAIHAHLQSNPDILGAISFEKRQFYVPFILLAYTTGQLLSFISSIFVEKYSEWINGYPSKYLLGYKPEKYFSGNRLIRFAVGVFLAPISIIEFMLNITLNYRASYAKPLDALLINIIKAKMLRLFQEKGGLTTMPENIRASNTDFFRFLYHYAVESAPNHFPKMQNYVAIYGFLRTLTLISVLLFWLVVMHIFSNHIYLWQKVAFICCAALLSFIFYMAFVKFWRRFSLEAMMAIAVTYEPKAKMNPKNIA